MLSTRGKRTPTDREDIRSLEPNRMTIPVSFEQVKTGIHQLSHNGVNVFLLDCHGPTLIDTGTPDMADMIVEGIRGLGHDPCAVGRILLTHAHPDHAGAAAFLQRALQAEVFCHPTEAELLRTGKVIRENFRPSPGLLNRLLYQTFISGAPQTVEPLEVDQLLTDGQEVIGDIRAIHTPGHAEGHLAFLWGETLFAGDAASNVGWLRAAIGTESYPRALGSIQKLCLSDFETACFGHGPPIKVGAAKRFQSRRWFDQGSLESSLN
jgi:glyoxylase-like metal-dependent hydrolase (beta-lactamase superfamily II)